jgi:hypothetical protein
MQGWVHAPKISSGLAKRKTQYWRPSTRRNGFEAAQLGSRKVNWHLSTGQVFFGLRNEPEADGTFEPRNVLKSWNWTNFTADSAAALQNENRVRPGDMEAWIVWLGWPIAPLCEICGRRTTCATGFWCKEVVWFWNRHPKSKPPMKAGQGTREPRRSCKG